jgi:hypothetical protein
MDAEEQHIALQLEKHEFLRNMQEALGIFLRVDHNHYWSEVF